MGELKKKPWEKNKYEEAHENKTDKSFQKAMKMEKNSTHWQA